MDHRGLTVDKSEEGGTDHGGEPGDCGNGALLEDARRDRGVVSLPELDSDKDDE